MSRRHRRKRWQRSQAEIMASYLTNVREGMVNALRAKFGDDFTPEMERKFREETPLVK